MKKTINLLQKHFDMALESPDGIKKLRELILTLAMQGRLVPQDPNDPPASQLLKEIQAEKERLITEGKIKKQKALPEIKPEDVPYEVPDGWVWTQIAALSKSIEYGTSQKTCLDSKLVPVYRMGNIVDGSLIDKNFKYIRPTIKDLPRLYLKKYDILFNRTNSYELVGKSALYLGNDDVKTFASYLIVIRLLTDYLSPLFFNRAMNSPYFRITQIEPQIVQQCGQANFNGTKLSRCLVPIPPLAEQKRIVARIDELMALCDKLEEQRANRDQKRLAVHTSAINRLLTAADKNEFHSSWKFITRHFDPIYSVKENVAELKKAILTLAMQGKLVPQNPNDPPASELLKEIQAEKEGLIAEGKIKKQKALPEIKPEEVPYVVPDGWVWVRLGDIGEINPRNNFDDNKDAGFVPMPKIFAEYGLQHSFEKRKWADIKKGYTHFSDGDIGLAKITPCFENGKSCVFSGLPNKMGAGTTELHIFRNTFSAIFPHFLLLYIKNPRYISEGQTKMTGSAGQKRVPTDYFSKNPFPLPPLAEQKRIVARIDELMALCDKLEGQINLATQKQTALFDAVLAKV